MNLALEMAVEDRSLILQQEPLNLASINDLDAALLARFQGRMLLDPTLSRTLVSFQANKTQPFYRWYKYKEAFSSALVEVLLTRYEIGGTVLDPFAGMGTTLFAASTLGLDADGIELLPVGQEIINSRLAIEKDFTASDLDRLSFWADTRPWASIVSSRPLNALRITRSAYSKETQLGIEQYLQALEQEDPRVQAALRLALLCILESVSFTRKDGQYLRWDHRSGRRQGTREFDKGPILPFEGAVVAKIRDMMWDLGERVQPSDLFGPAILGGDVRLVAGSCLDVLLTLDANHYDAIVTSPPYCNRYDYTRTYALELALLGVSESELSKLRQCMLSCTVENRQKNLLDMNQGWRSALDAAHGQELLQAILSYLEDQKADGLLNNNGIPRMVRGYFYEMACVIAECARTLKRGGLLLMVNDNVRYAGASVPVDMILSDIAERLGFFVENILVLPNGKGNSSQQMGEHGRVSLRKCVYVWRKT